MDEGLEEGELLLRPPGEVAHLHPGFFQKAVLLQKRLGPPPGRPQGEAPGHPEVDQVLQGGEPPVDVVVALQHRSQVAEGGGVLEGVLAQKADLPPIGEEEA